MESERLNSPSTSTIILEVLGHQLQFSQDPNSKHLGTTVWDASMVFAKFLEKNSRKGRFCRSKLKGKRAIELGAGCGVAGFGMALLGCNVVATDQIEVLPLLRRNAERNTSIIMQTDASSDSFGSVQVAELDWGNEDHIRALDPPFDYIIGTDVVYTEHLLEPLLKTIHELSGPKTTILLGYEIRSMNVHEQMLEMWKRNFEVKLVPKTKMHSKYQHSSIQLYIMGLKSPVGRIGNMNPEIDQGSDKIRMVDKILQEVEKDGPSIEEVDNDGDFGTEKVDRDSESLKNLPNGNLTDWEARRVGSMAARLLRDIKIA